MAASRLAADAWSDLEPQAAHGAAPGESTEDEDERLDAESGRCAEPLLPSPTSSSSGARDADRGWAPGQKEGERASPGQVGRAVRAACEGVAPATGGGREPGGLLDHVFGVRFVLSVWILADHFVHRACVLVDRANVAVDWFIIMSGFMTHWAYGGRSLRGAGAVWQFYVRRIGRVLLTTYLSMAVATLVMALTAQLPEAMHLLRCACFVETWWAPEEWCPNGQTWTIAALMPSWLLYPWTQQLVAGLEEVGGGRALWALFFALWLASFGPMLLLFAAQGGWITTRQHNFAYVWPPSQMGDFAMGMVAAALARRHDRADSARGVPSRAGGSPVAAVSLPPGAVRRGQLADLCLLLVLAAVLLPPTSGYHIGWEPLYNHACAPALAAFLYGASASGGSGVAAWLLSRWPLTQLGAYSFEVFLFQQPLFSIFETVWIAGLNEVFNISLLGILFVVALYGLSALYADKVEAPFVHFLRDVTAGWA